MKFKISALMLVLGLSSTPVMAQTASENSSGPTAAEQSPIKVYDSNGEIRPASCEDFVHNPNGSWSPNKRVIIRNGVSIGPGVAFRPGVKLNGIDLGGNLNNQCIDHKNK